MPDVEADKRALRELIVNWVIWRDAGMWERFRTVWHDDGVMMATWFQGTCDEFIRVSREGWEKGVLILHFLGGMSVEVQGARAVAQTKMTISQRGPVDGVTCDVVCTGRFYDFLEKRDGRWGMVLRQPIYEKDRIDPVDPAARLYPHTDEDMIHDWFSFVAARVNIGIWLFDTPYSGRPAISPATTARIAEIENICGAKLARSLDHYVEVRRLVGDRIVLSSPSETDFLMMIRHHGQKVHQSSASPYLMQTPAWQPMREYAELAWAGRIEEAEAISATLDPLRAVARRWLHGRWHETKVLPIAGIKAWSEALGMAAGPVRTPLLQMTDADRRAMREEIEATGLLAKERPSTVAYS